MNYIKEKLKKNLVIVSLYELILGKLNKLRIVKYIKFRLKNKIHYSYGEKNPDKTFLICSEFLPTEGIYSIIFSLLPYIEYAIKKHYIPVVDLTKVFMPHLQDEDEGGITNPWEYYYEQPLKQYTLEEVYQSKHIIMAMRYAFMYKIKLSDWHQMFSTGNEKEIAYWSKIITSYIRPNSELQNKIIEQRNNIFPIGQKICGISIRAGMLRGELINHPLFNNHPKHPSLEELINIVEKKIKEWEYDFIFLACDDREYLNNFIEHFGSKCCYVQRRLIHYFKNGTPVPIDAVQETTIEFEGSTVRERTEAYIIETYLLAQCNSLIACHGSSGMFARLLNGGQYEHVEVIDKGWIKIQ